jgi:hypothetical protein
MELADIKRNALAARMVSVEVAPATFALTLPTNMQSSIAYTQALRGGSFDSAAQIRFQRGLLLDAVTGWSGVLLRHVLLDHQGDDALDFELGAVELLMDAKPDWESQLISALLDGVAERKAKEDTAAKN